MGSEWGEGGEGGEVNGECAYTHTFEDIDAHEHGTTPTNIRMYNCKTEHHRHRSQFQDI